MANNNVVSADLNGGWSCVTAPLWQWDYGQVLEITGIDDLPSSFVAHCANRWDGSSQTVLGSNGRLSIPNDLLTSGEPVYVWIILTADGTDGETKYKITIPVNRRAAPTDYPTTAQQSAITQAINALNTAAASAAAEVAENLVDDTLSVTGKAADAAKTGEELSKLKSDVNDGLIVLAGLYINGANWTSNSRVTSILIPVQPGDKFEVQGTTVGSDSRISILKNVTFPVISGSTVYYSSALGFDEVIVVEKNATFSQIIPADGEYIYCYYGFNIANFDRKPQSLTINGYNYIAKVIDNIKTNSTINAKLEYAISKLGDYDALQWYKGRFNNGVWVTDVNNSAYLRVTPGASYKIQAALNNNSPIAALKSAVLPPVDGALIDYSSAEGWTSVVTPSYGAIIEGTIPEDVNYLYFYFGDNATLSRMPEKIIIDGYDVKLTVVQSVVDNATKTEELKSVNNSELPIFARERNIRSYGHGGYTVTYPFNSLMSYRDAKQHGFEWAETDVQFTSDNVPVLCHDNGLYTYARNPDGTRIGTSLTDTVYISDITYNELLYYDFGLAKSASLAEMKITTFEELMQSARRMNLSIAIEIKRDKTPTNAQIDILFDLIDKYHMRQNVNFCSAVTSALVYIHGKDPSMELTYIVSSITSAATAFIESIRGYNRVAIAASTGITDEMVLLAKEHNIPINIGPVNNDSDILDANAYITHFTSNGPIAEKVMLDYELSQL